MATVNEKMTALADAIRAKTGGTEALTLDGMAEAVSSISIPEYNTLYIDTVAPTASDGADGDVWIVRG